MSNVHNRTTIPCPSNPESERPTIPVPATDLLWYDAAFSEQFEIEVDVAFDSLEIAERIVDDAAPLTQRSRLALVVDRIAATRGEA